MKINKELKDEYQWKWGWKNRAAFIGRIIPPGVSVLDIGGGFGNIYKYLNDCPNYRSIDIKKWTDETIVADFNKDEYPDINDRFQIILCQGIIEYIDERKNFLEKIKKYGTINTKMIMTYRQEDGKPSVAEIRQILIDTGWKILLSRQITGSQKLFYCSKI